MCSSSEIRVDGLVVCLDIISKLAGHLKGGFSTDGSEVSSLEEGILEINRSWYGG